ncbi:MAG: FAD-dependent monooxygenase [Caulobacterales bacterium]|nr:FAD-dependent monooxygenase [Caulobacterales bacterium]
MFGKSKPKSARSAPVVIVGGGPVGVAAAGYLADQGVASIVLEKRAETSRHPKARGINARGMELFRQLGCELHLRAACEPVEAVSRFAVGASLGAPDLKFVPFDAADLASHHFTPATGVVTSQDVVEEVLLRCVLAKGLPDIRRLHEVTRVEQTAEEVRIDVTGPDGSETLTADYVIAADGARSGLRDQLGLSLEGVGDIKQNLNFMFRSKALQERLTPMNVAFLALQHRGRMTVLSGRPTGRCDHEWTLNIQLEPGESIEDFSEADMIALTRTACDMPDMDIEPCSLLPWSASAMVLESFMHGRVGFVGDAAHLMPPAGALGMNTGLQDAQNLVWKIAEILHGRADPSLLDSYTAERQPICRQVVSAARANLAKLEGGAAGRERMWGGSQAGIVLGFAYESGAFLAEPEDVRRVPDNPYSQYIPDARPGMRAPHAPLRGASGMSVLDFFGRSFVLVAGPGGARWRGAARSFAPGLAPLALVAGEDFELADGAEPAFLEAYGVEEDGAVLVRPDGIVGARWRSAPASPESALGEGLTACGLAAG